MKRVSVLAWLRTGTFGPVALGATRSQVQLASGEPDDSGGTSRRRRTPSIWKYGDIELHFGVDGRVCLVYLDHFQVPTGGAAIDLDPWVLRGGLPREDVARHLTAEHIAFRVLGDSGNDVHLVLPADITLTFIEHRTPSCPPVGLSSISHCLGGGRAPPDRGLNRQGDARRQTCGSGVGAPSLRSLYRHRPPHRSISPVTTQGPWT